MVMMTMTTTMKMTMKMTMMMILTMTETVTQTVTGVMAVVRIHQSMHCDDRFCTGCLTQLDMLSYFRNVCNFKFYWVIIYLFFTSIGLMSALDPS